MNTVRAERLPVVLDNGCSLDWMVRESGARMEIPGRRVQPLDRFRFRELRTLINGSGPAHCMLIPIEHHESVADLIAALARTGIVPHQHTTLRHTLCLVYAIEDRPACMHCTRQIVILDPNVVVWDSWFEAGIIPTIAILTDVPVWPTVRLVLHNRLSSVLRNQPAHVLLRA